MELRHLRYFVMAAEERNISRASARLNISQPAVSRQIKDLEDELGVELFLRKRDGLELTPAGEKALEHARGVLRQSVVMEEAMQPYRDAANQVTITVGYLAAGLAGFLTDVLRQFSDAFPHVCVQIREMPPVAQEEALRKDELDIALLGTACPELKKLYEIREIHTTPMALVMPDDHPLAGRKALGLAELEGESFVTLNEKQFPGRPEMMKDLFDRAGIEAEITLKANGLTELLALVGTRAGVAIAPADLERLPHHGVRFVKLKKPTLTLTASAVWKEARETRELLALIDLLEDGES